MLGAKTLLTVCSLFLAGLCQSSGTSDGPAQCAAGGGVDGDGGCKISILIKQLKGGPSFTLEAGQFDTVRSVKDRVQAESPGFDARHQQLSFEGEALENDRTLADYNITTDHSRLLLHSQIDNITRSDPPQGTIQVLGSPSSEAVRWHKIGQQAHQYPLSFLRGLFDSLVVNITSADAVPYKVYWYGGLAMEPKNSEYWNRKYCGSFFRWDSKATCENVALSRFGIWAPFGTTYIGVLEDRQPKSNKQSFDYIISYTTVFDRKMATRFAAGLLLLLLANFLSYRREMHVSIATGLGVLSVVLVVLFFLVKVVPFKKKTILLTFIVGGLGVAANLFIDGIVDYITQHAGIFVPIFIGGACLGGSLGYMYTPFSPKTQDVVSVNIQVLAVALIFSGTNSATLSLIITVIVVFGRFLSGVYIARLFSCCTSRNPDRKGNIDKKEVYFNAEVESDDDFHHDGPVQRSKLRKYMIDNMGEEDAQSFYVEGAPEYISQEDYERETTETTERELKKLSLQLAEGGNWINTVSIRARTEIGKMLSSLDDASSDESESDEDNAPNVTED